MHGALTPAWLHLELACPSSRTPSRARTAWVSMLLTASLCHETARSPHMPCVRRSAREQGMCTIGARQGGCGTENTAPAPEWCLGLRLRYRKRFNCALTMLPVWWGAWIQCQTLRGRSCTKLACCLAQPSVLQAHPGLASCEVKRWRVTYGCTLAPFSTSLRCRCMAHKQPSRPPKHTSHQTAQSSALSRRLKPPAR